MRLRFVFAVVCVGGLAGCFGSPSTIVVNVSDDVFEESEVTIRELDSVRWHNNGKEAHSITIKDKNQPNEGTKKDVVVAPGDQTSHQFFPEGTYVVYCRFHSQGTSGDFSQGMLMSVVVS